MTILNLQWNNKSFTNHFLISWQTNILRPIKFGWTYFIKKQILGDVFHLSLVKKRNNNILFANARRICTIVENKLLKQVRRKKRLDELQKVLYSQEYPESLIQETIQKATSIPIKNLRVSKVKIDSNNLAFVATFNPRTKTFSL